VLEQSLQVDASGSEAGMAEVVHVGVARNHALPAGRDGAAA
jgi:hypothetical protein